MKLLFFCIIVGAILTGCKASSAERREVHMELESGSYVKSIQISEDELMQEILRNDSAFVFLTTGWCIGGKWTLNNTVLPGLNDLKGQGVAFFIVYLGKVTDPGIDPGKLEQDTLVIYNISELRWDNPLGHKLRINKLLSKLDKDRKWRFAVPRSCWYRKGGGSITDNLGGFFSRSTSD